MRAADTAACLQDVFIAVLRSLLQTWRSTGSVVLPEAASPDSPHVTAARANPQQEFQDHPLEYKAVGRSHGKEPWQGPLPSPKCVLGLASVKHQCWLQLVQVSSLRWLEGGGFNDLNHDFN